MMLSGRVTDNAELTARCFERLGVAPFCVFQLGIIRKSAEWPKSEVGNQMRFLIHTGAVGVSFK